MLVKLGTYKQMNEGTDIQANSRHSLLGLNNTKWWLWVVIPPVTDL